MKHFCSRALFFLLPFVLLLAACQSAPPTAAPTAAATGPALELVGPGGTKSLTLADLSKLPAVEGWGGIKSSTGKITVPELFKGVALDELCKQVGGLDQNSGVSVEAKDGYAMTISYGQIVNGEFITYDPGTGDEVQIDRPLQVIVAYERDGKPLPSDTDGAFRLMVVSPKNNQVVDGHWSVKWVSRIALKSLAQEWKLNLTGAIDEEMDRGTFESCSAPACHGASWKDDKAQTWTGVPLWLLAARVDDDNKHGDDAFNKQLAQKGYRVVVVAADGYKVTCDIARLTQNKNILLAHQVNGNPLDEKYFPLRLVGADLQKNELAGQVTALQVVMTTAQPVTATTTPTSTEPSMPQAATGAAGLAVLGAVEKELTLTQDAFKAVGVVQVKAEHPKKGMQDYEGVRLNALLDLAGVQGDATMLILTAADGYQIQLSLTDLRKCVDCLLTIDGDKFNTVMPGMQSNVWAKDIVQLQVK